MSGHHYYHHRRPSNQRAISELPPTAPYPGVNPYADFQAEAGGSDFYPYSNAVQPPLAPFEGIQEVGANYPVPVSAITPAPTNSSSSGGLASLLSGLNLSNLDIKGIIEKMGGIDGLVANMGKVQKVMQGVQQLAPVMSLLTGVFGKKGKGASSNATHSINRKGSRSRRRRSGSSTKQGAGSRRPSSGKRRRS